MGHDVTLQAVAVPSRLIDSVRDGSVDTELLVFIDYYFEARRERGPRWDNFTKETPSTYSPSRRLFAELVEEMLSENPGIDQRCFELHRQYDWLQTTLGFVAKSRGDLDYAQWSVRGEHQISSDARSTQGFPINWNAPETCQMIHLWLDDIDGQEVVAACDVDKLRFLNVYKIMQAADDESVRESVLQNFNALKSFYQLISEAGDGVIVDMD